MAVFNDAYTMWAESRPAQARVAVFHSGSAAEV